MAGIILSIFVLVVVVVLMFKRVLKIKRMKKVQAPVKNVEWVFEAPIDRSTDEFIAISKPDRQKADAPLVRRDKSQPVSSSSSHSQKNRYNDGLTRNHCLSLENQNSKLRKMALIRKKPPQVDCCSSCQAKLVQETVYIASYPVAHFKEVGKSNYITATVLTCQTCRYICEEEAKIVQLQEQAKPYWIDVQPWDVIVEPPLKMEKAPETKPFKWPSTFAVETLKPNQGMNGYKQESDLHKLGYRIAGLSRHARWVILESEALPKLGLESIANTIAANVRQRKRQKGGKIKYARAIKEWEHDLDELKKQYYRWDFTWPHSS